MEHGIVRPITISLCVYLTDTSRLRSAASILLHMASLKPFNTYKFYLEIEYLIIFNLIFAVVRLVTLRGKH